MLRPLAGQHLGHGWPLRPALRHRRGLRPDEALPRGLGLEGLHRGPRLRGRAPNRSRTRQIDFLAALRADL